MEAEVVFLLVLSTFVMLVDGIPKSTPSSKRGVTTRPYDGTDPYALYLPPFSNDETGPPDEKNKNSSTILDNLNKNASFWRKSTMMAAENDPDVNSPATVNSDLGVVDNVSEAPLTTVQSYDNASTLVSPNVTMTVTTEILNTSFPEIPENQSTVEPPTDTDKPISTETSKMVSSPVPVMESSSPSLSSLLSTMSSSTTQAPKMPARTTSSIPLFTSSPVTVNDTSHHPHRKTRHPIIFFLLPFLVAGGVAFCIFLGSYLRKKIR